MSKVGRKEVVKSLDTRDPDEAKRRFAEALAEIEGSWARTRSGPPPLTDREAHALAQTVGNRWFQTYLDDASTQVLWHPEIYADLWSREPLSETEAGKFDPENGERTPGSIPLENIFSRSMRNLCVDEARQLLVDHGFDDDEWSIHRAARPVGAALQEASVELQRLEKGGYRAPSFSTPRTPAVVSSQAREGPSVSIALAEPLPAAVSLTALVEDWWREAKATGRKPSTYESYRNSIATLVRFLGHDDALKVRVSDVVGFKDGSDRHS